MEYRCKHGNVSVNCAECSEKKALKQVEQFNREQQKRDNRLTHGKRNRSW